MHFVAFARVSMRTFRPSIQPSFARLITMRNAVSSPDRRVLPSERVRRVGVLMAHNDGDPEFQNYLGAFREGLQNRQSPWPDSATVATWARRRIDRAVTLSHVRFWHKADIPRLSSDVRFWGVKRTLPRRPPMSAFDPKRTFAAQDCCCAN